MGRGGSGGMEGRRMFDERRGMNDFVVGGYLICLFFL